MYMFIKFVVEIIFLVRGWTFFGEIRRRRKKRGKRRGWGVGGYEELKEGERVLMGGGCIRSGKESGRFF